jgi:hypothetical protein
VARPTRRPSTHPARGASKIARPSSHVAARDGKKSSAHMHMPPALPGGQWGATTKPDQPRVACRAAQAPAVPPIATSSSPLPAGSASRKERSPRPRRSALDRSARRSGPRGPAADGISRSWTVSRPRISRFAIQQPVYVYARCELVAAASSSASARQVRQDNGMCALISENTLILIPRELPGSFVRTKEVFSFRTTAGTADPDPELEMVKLNNTT